MQPLQVVSHLAAIIVSFANFIILSVCMAILNILKEKLLSSHDFAFLN